MSDSEPPDYSGLQLRITLQRLHEFLICFYRAVLRLHVVCPSVCPSVRLSVCHNVGGSGSHRLEVLETNCTDN